MAFGTERHFLVAQPDAVFYLPSLLRTERSHHLSRSLARLLVKMCDLVSAGRSLRIQLIFRYNIQQLIGKIDSNPEKPDLGLRDFQSGGLRRFSHGGHIRPKASPRGFRIAIDKGGPFG